ncbi:DEAH-box ATP-dependent RNA helicase prp22 [Irineochytrium annulatum]|nr:DEAH-box ATP-dependent RNA helicase prp22 [Irineochytrium annulatum]
MAAGIEAGESWRTAGAGDKRMNASHDRRGKTAGIGGRRTGEAVRSHQRERRDARDERDADDRGGELGNDTLQHDRQQLPIFQYRDDLIAACRDHQILIVVGDTGSGKTTQFPQYLHESSPSHRIIITQPRRIAAISAATRVAQETGTPLGDLVGYSIRFESRRSAATKLLYMTDGTLLRTLASQEVNSEGKVERKVEGVEVEGGGEGGGTKLSETLAEVVILDEAHERSLETDVLFGLLRRACEADPALRVVVMSATLNVDKFSSFFGDAPVFSIPGRMFKVDVLFAREGKLASLQSAHVRKAVDAVMQVHKNEDAGDVLVFLTGQQEIELACRLIQQACDELRPAELKAFPEVKDLQLYPIYSALDTPEQRAVFSKAREGCRKCVVATNIAQTSVTIPGIRYVIDCGFVKEKMFDPKTGVDALMVVPVSKAAATQRAGRAGRTAPGKVFRLYTREIFDSLPEDTTPEIQRSSLLTTVLSLKKMHIHNPLTFDFLDPPDPDLVVTALRQLHHLSCLDDDGRLTKLGNQVSEFPLSPFLGVALVAACERYGCGAELATLAAMLSSEDPWITPRDGEKRMEAEHEHGYFRHPTGDHMALLQLYDAWDEAGGDANWCRARFIRHRALRNAKSVRGQVVDVLARLGLRVESCRDRAPTTRDKGRNGDGGHHHVPDGPDATPILKSLCEGLFINTAKRHPQHPYFYHYLGATGVSLSSSSTAPGGGGGGADSSALTSLHLSPTSCLNDGSGTVGALLRGVEWCVYQDLQYVNRVTMRVVSRVELEWVKAGLDRCKGCDVDRLCGVVKEPVVEVGKRKSASAGKEGRKKRRRSSTGDVKAAAEKEKGVEVAPVKTKEELEREREEKTKMAKERFLARSGRK